MDWQPDTTRYRQSDPDPGALARELGYDTCASSAADNAEGADDADYCSFCWSALPPGAAACGDCGRTLAEMMAARAAVAEMDRQWVPPRLRETAYDEGEVVTATVAAEPYPSHADAELAAVPPQRPARQRPARPARPSLRFDRAVFDRARPVFFTAALFALFMASGVAGQWLAVATFPKSSLDPKAAAALSANMPARVHWKRSAAGLRCMLVSPEGAVVAKSTEPAVPGGRRLKPGIYKLRVTDRTRRWRSKDRVLRARAGKLLLLGATHQEEAAYWVWTSRRLEAAGKRAEALRALQQAVLADPGSREARQRMPGLLR